MIDLSEQAKALVSPGKGLLAADESNESTDTKRLAPNGIPTGEEMHRQFREMLLDAPGIEKYLSGVILYKETLDQKNDSGVPFTEMLSTRGIMPGIKVDEGLEPFPDSKDETITKGLVGLSERLAAYRSKYGTGFTKWRAAIKIDGDHLPTNSAIMENAKRLATYALEAQKAGMVPLVEPEVLLDGNHSRLRSREVITKVLSTLVSSMEDQAVDLAGVVIKTSMALSGSTSGRTDTPEEVAEDTLGALMEAVPASIPGIVFLSGGQTPDQSIDNLRAIVKLAREKSAPWPLTFSFARAFQDEALKIWLGKPENLPAAREALLKRLSQASNATLGF